VTWTLETFQTIGPQKKIVTETWSKPEKHFIKRELFIDLIEKNYWISISRNHAELSYEPEGIFTITNLSQGGMWINDVAIPKNQKRTLQRGDKIYVINTDHFQVGFIFTYSLETPIENIIDMSEEQIIGNTITTTTKNKEDIAKNKEKNKRKKISLNTSTQTVPEKSLEENWLETKKSSKDIKKENTSKNKEKKKSEEKSHIITDKNRKKILSKKFFRKRKNLKYQKKRLPGPRKSNPRKKLN
jgi:hypothetical protein